jgi:hypothetical protein
MVAATSSSTPAQGGYRIVASGMLRGSGGRFGGCVHLVFKDGQYVQSFRTEAQAKRFIAGKGAR